MAWFTHGFFDKYLHMILLLLCLIITTFIENYNNYRLNVHINENSWFYNFLVSFIADYLRSFESAR